VRYYKAMECPFCKQAMKRVRKDTSRNPNEDNKEYGRTVYQCTADDVWITIEIPESSK